MPSKAERKPVRAPLTVDLHEILEELRTFLHLELDIETDDVSMDAQLTSEPLRLDPLAITQMWDYLADQFQLETVPEEAIWFPETVGQLCEEAKRVIADPLSYVPAASAAEPPAAFMFAGQGTQKVGMAKGLVAKSTIAKTKFNQAQSILNYDLLEVCLNGPENKLGQTNVCQPAILVTSLARVDQLRNENADLVNQCDICCGLSLGEYSALVFAGALTFEDAVRLVAVRGKAMQTASEAVPSGMTSILGLDFKTVTQLVNEVAKKFADKTIVIANDLCPGNIVISGHNECLDEAERMAMSEDYAAKKVRRLQVAGAFHSPLMDPAVEAIKNQLEKTTISKPTIPVILNTTAKPTKDVSVIREQLVHQVTQPVLWRASMEKMMQSHEKLVEIGPGDILRGLGRHVSRSLKKTVAIESFDCL